MTSPLRNPQNNRLIRSLVVIALALPGLHSMTLAAEERRGDVTHPDFTEAEVGFFTRDVWPILEANCVKCHGGRNDKGQVKIKSGFQVISRAGIVIGGAHGSAYDQNSPKESLILKMIRYAEEDYQMPPEGKLPQNQIDTLTRWVEAGMPWDPSTINRIEHIEEVSSGAFPPGEVSDAARKWWSNKPMEKPVVPVVPAAEWNANPIDAFIYAQLIQNQLTPNPEADKSTLIRRAYFNLIGLPPTADEMEEFEMSTDPDAWKNLVDSLLSRPEYGEKWSRHWLDVVRYAESNGFERDSEKDHIWRFRDYVIDSFNQDKPWDRFTMEQIAGDEMSHPTRDSLIATGYHRLMQWDDEPADRLQHVYDVLDDNVRTTSEGFLAMTLGCARCHEHKADPILQEDYYRFMAFFHGITQMSRNNVIETVPDPSAAAFAEEQKKQNLAEQAKVQARLEQIEIQARQLFVEKDPAIARALNPKPVENPILVNTSDASPRIWHYSTGKPTDDWFEVSFRHEEKWKSGPAPFGNGHPGGSKHPTAWTTEDIWIRTSFQLSEIPDAVELRIFHDEDAVVYLNGQKIAEFSGYTVQYVAQLLTKQAMQALQTGRNTLAIHCRQSSGGQLIDAGLFILNQPVSITQLIEQRGTEIFPAGRVTSYRNDLKKLKELKAMSFIPGVPAMVVQERGGKPADLHIHIRGSAHAPGEKVEPGFPHIFGYSDPQIPARPDSAKSSGRRLALAEWMTRDDNPRTSRVMVNRVWQHHFGRGICPTPSDFGVLGMEPTHPELLDWLATHFVEHGWSLKALHRQIMLSRAYRMSSAPNSKALAIDPVNNHFWRMDMRRLSAEEMRDSILAVIGKINLRKGGPSFFPILPDAVLATSSTKDGKWGSSSEDDLFRRSIYIKIKRSLQPPELIDFDFADTDAPCPVRFTTTVPTQALNSLNSQFMNDRASDFAERLIRETGGGASRNLVIHAIQVALGRNPQEWEIDQGLDLFNKLKRQGQISDRDAIERLCLIVLNLNEFVYLD